MIIFILVMILLFLLGMIGDERGVASMLTFIGNIAVFFVSLEEMFRTGNVYVVTFVAVLGFLLLTLFAQNGFNKKTISAFFSIVIILNIVGIFSIILIKVSSMAGFGEMYIYDEEVAFLENKIGISAQSLLVSSILIGILGAITDTALSVSSTMYEVHEHNPALDAVELNRSGNHVGWDILGTTFSTLVFAEIGQGFFIWLIFAKNKYSFVGLINSKSFLQQTFLIIMASLGSLLIIPLTSRITAKILTGQGNWIKLKKQ
jgi:uncharacterized membrane protein